MMMSSWRPLTRALCGLLVVVNAPVAAQSAKGPAYKAYAASVNWYFEPQLPLPDKPNQPSELKDRLPDLSSFESALSGPLSGPPC